jgi:HEPN domain-containing protein
MSKRQHEQALMLVRKAQDDLALLAEVRHAPKVSDEIIGFHCQQAAEKLLKALLSESGVDFPRTHNLRFLMDLLTDAGSAVPEDVADLDMLTPFGTLLRYDDLGAGASLQRDKAVEMVKALHAWVTQRVR